MGKTKPGFRTKGNVQASSSAKSAELLQSSGNDFSNPFVNAIFEDATEQLDTDFVVALKKLSKKDPNTRIKGLQDIKQFYASKEKHLITPTIATFFSNYSKTALDNNKRVRELAYECLGALLQVVGKLVAPHLKQVVVVWLMSQCDTTASCAAAARKVFDEAFNSQRQASLASLYQHDVINSLTGNLFKLSVNSISAQKICETDEVEGRFVRLLTSSMDALTRLVHLLPPTNQSAAALKLVKVLFDESKFWKFSKSQYPSVKRAFLDLVTCLLHATNHQVPTIQQSATTTTESTTASPTKTTTTESTTITTASPTITCTTLTPTTEASTTTLTLTTVTTPTNLATPPTTTSTILATSSTSTATLTATTAATTPPTTTTSTTTTATTLSETQEQALVSNVLQLLDNSNHSIIASFWRCFHAVVTHIPDPWRHVNMQKMFLPKLWSLIDACSTAHYAHFLTLLHHLPPSTKLDQAFQQKLFHKLYSSLSNSKVFMSVPQRCIVVETIVQAYKYSVSCTEDASHLTNILGLLFKDSVLDERFSCTAQSTFERVWHLFFHFHGIVSAETSLRVDKEWLRRSYEGYARCMAEAVKAVLVEGRQGGTSGKLLQFLRASVQVVEKRKKSVSFRDVVEEEKIGEGGGGGGKGEKIDFLEGVGDSKCGLLYLEDAVFRSFIVDISIALYEHLTDFCNDANVHCSFSFFVSSYASSGLLCHFRGRLQLAEDASEGVCLDAFMRSFLFPLIGRTDVSNLPSSLHTFLACLKLSSEKTGDGGGGGSEWVGFKYLTELCEYLRVEDDVKVEGMDGTKEVIVKVDEGEIGEGVLGETRVDEVVSCLLQMAQKDAEVKRLMNAWIEKEVSARETLRANAQKYYEAYVAGSPRPWALLSHALASLHHPFFLLSPLLEVLQQSFHRKQETCIELACKLLVHLNEHNPHALLSDEPSVGRLLEILIETSVDLHNVYDTSQATQTLMNSLDVIISSKTTSQQECLVRVQQVVEKLEIKVASYDGLVDVGRIESVVETTEKVLKLLLQRGRWEGVLECFDRQSTKPNEDIMLFYFLARLLESLYTNETHEDFKGDLLSSQQTRRYIARFCSTLYRLSCQPSCLSYSCNLSELFSFFLKKGVSTSVAVSLFQDMLQTCLKKGDHDSNESFISFYIFLTHAKDYVQDPLDASLVNLLSRFSDDNTNANLKTVLLLLASSSADQRHTPSLDWITSSLQSLPKLTRALTLTNTLLMKSHMQGDYCTDTITSAISTLSQSDPDIFLFATDFNATLCPLNCQVIQLHASYLDGLSMSAGKASSGIETPSESPASTSTSIPSTIQPSTSSSTNTQTTSVGASLQPISTAPLQGTTSSSTTSHSSSSSSTTTAIASPRHLPHLPVVMATTLWDTLSCACISWLQTCSSHLCSSKGQWMHDEAFVHFTTAVLRLIKSFQKLFASSTPDENMKDEWLNVFKPAVSQNVCQMFREMVCKREPLPCRWDSVISELCECMSACEVAYLATMLPSISTHVTFDADDLYSSETAEAVSSLVHLLVSLMEPSPIQRQSPPVVHLSIQLCAHDLLKKLLKVYARSVDERFARWQSEHHSVRSKRGEEGKGEEAVMEEEEEEEVEKIITPDTLMPWFAQALLNTQSELVNSFQSASDIKATSTKFNGLINTNTSPCLPFYLHYFLLCDLLLEMTSFFSSKLKISVCYWMGSSGFFSNHMDAIFSLIFSSPASSLQKTAHHSIDSHLFRVPLQPENLLRSHILKHFDYHPLKHPLILRNDAFLSPSSEELDTHLSSNPLDPLKDLLTQESTMELSFRTYVRTCQHLPLPTRTWFANLPRKAAAFIDRYTTQHVSEAYIARELSSLHQSDSCDKAFGQNLRVSVRPSSREMVASYLLDDVNITLAIAYPDNAPLGNLEIKGDVDKVVSIKHDVAALKFKLYKLLRFQEGSLREALKLWQRTLDKQLDGQSCMICYSLVLERNGTKHLPTLQCKTCHKMFHNLCLYTWFKTSNKSLCPLCRTEFV